MSRTAIPFTQVVIDDAFWMPRIKALREQTLHNCLDFCEETGRIANFRRAAGFEEGEFQGIYFNDSDVYKVLEGIGYTLQTAPDSTLEARADEVIESIVAAQQEDGYLFCYYILANQDSRWTDMEKHEMYCAGHLIEAAIAYHQATNKDKLLKAAIRFADHIDSLFGLGKRHWVPGHQEIELALVKLYKHVNEPRYLDVFSFF